MIKNLRVATWTHSTYNDVWDAYYGQFKQHAGFLKHTLIINQNEEYEPNFCDVVYNKEDDPFYKRLVESLDHIEEDNIIYSHEDHLLYGDVKKENIENLNNFLIDSNYDFLRFMKSGVEGGKKIHNDLNIYEIPQTGGEPAGTYSHPYIFSCQTTLWKRKRLQQLMNSYKPKNILEAERLGTYACLALGITGCYIFNEEPKRGRLHHDSSVFPYISTALHGGSYGLPSMWAMDIYKNELEIIFKKYNIDPSKRGVHS